MHIVLGRRLAATRPASFVSTARNYSRAAQQRGYAEQHSTSTQRDPQLGDYPDVPPVYRDTLPPSLWWDNQMRRNFGDVPHPEDEMYSMWGPDPPKVPPRDALLQFSLATALFGGIMYFAYKNQPQRLALPRQYPYDGLVQDLAGLEDVKARPESLEDEDEV